jgi:hydroxymethylbilane synthase
MILRVGTRGSTLAMWQAKYVASLIETKHSDIQIELVKIKTTGDKILDAPLARIGGKGLFTKEIEEALLDGRVDLAVHSMKDLPTELPEGLKLGAIMEREDPRDAFISRDGRLLDQLEKGEKIGTSSLRRQAFLLNIYPDIDIVSIRGNVDTRLRKVESEDLAGIMLASAGVRRMGFEDRITTYMQPEIMIPAIGQGALGIEIRADDSRVEPIVSELNHETTATCILVERAFLQRMGGGCQVPLAAHAQIENDSMTVRTAVVHPNGSPMMREQYSGPMQKASLGSQLADTLLSQGADKIMKSVNGDEWSPGPATDR